MPTEIEINNSQPDPQIWLFDLDETLWVAEDNVFFGDAHVVAYGYNLSPLHAERLSAIFGEIISKGHSIGFITAGSWKPEHVSAFFKKTYGIRLKPDFIFYSDTRPRSEKKALSFNKVEYLKKIAAEKNCSRYSIVFVDDNAQYVNEAQMAGFTAIHADNLKGEDGQSYLEKLEALTGAKTGQRKNSKGSFFKGEYTLPLVAALALTRHFSSSDRRLTSSQYIALGINLLSTSLAFSVEKRLYGFFSKKKDEALIANDEKELRLGGFENEKGSASLRINPRFT